MEFPARKLFALISQSSQILNDLEHAGIRVELGDDFTRYRALRAQTAERGMIYPMFDTASSFIDHRNGFWICGFSPDGELIHTQAVRFLDLAGVTLQEHLHTHRHKYITPDSTPDPDQTHFIGPNALNVITGRVCYHGEFWLRARGLGGPRSQGATALLSRLLLEIMVYSWAPDFVFALVPKRLAEKGTHLRYGYTRCEPGRWMGPDHQITDEDHLIWMGRADLAGLIAEKPHSLGRQSDKSNTWTASNASLPLARLDTAAND